MAMVEHNIKKDSPLDLSTLRPDLGASFVSRYDSLRTDKPNVEQVLINYRRTINLLKSNDALIGKTIRLLYVARVNKSNVEQYYFNVVAEIVIHNKLYLVSNKGDLLLREEYANTLNRALSVHSFINEDSLA